MRLKTYITISPEQADQMNIGGWEALKTMLEKNCMPYIKQLKGAKSLLLRGSKKSIKMFDKVSQRQDRRPLLISDELHEVMDPWTLKNWGFKARSASTFTTNNKKAAKSYGSPYLMFPIGNFNYAWNDYVQKLYGEYDRFHMNVSSRELIDNRNSTSKSEEIDRKEAAKREFEDRIVPELKDYKVNKGLNKYLYSRQWHEDGFSECIVNCKSYYMINPEWDMTLLMWYSERYWKQK